LSSLVSSLIGCPERADAYIIPFLHDQQECGRWYLYINQQNEICILVGYSELTILTDPENDYSEKFRLEILNNTYVCALSFEEFIYRFWLEDMISWY
jgi:hypothetical protein